MANVVKPFDFSRKAAKPGDIVRAVDTLYEMFLRLQAIVPTGTIAAGLFENGQDPEGWLICDGRNSFGAAQYPELAKLLKNRYGGDGTTTFGIPDLRGKFLAGRAVDPSTSNRVGALATFGAAGSTYGFFNINWVIKT